MYDRFSNYDYHALSKESWLDPPDERNVLEIDRDIINEIGDLLIGVQVADEYDIDSLTKTIGKFLLECLDGIN
jgi:hypothetical protein